MAVETTAPFRRVVGTLIRGVADGLLGGAQGIPLAGAQVTATASVKSAASGEFIVLDPVDGTTDQNARLRNATTGEDGILLLVTDDPSLGVIGWTWHITITAPSLQRPGQPPRTVEFDIDVPSGEGDLDLATLVPVPGNVGEDVILWRAAVEQTAANLAASEAIVATSVNDAAVEGDMLVLKTREGGRIEAGNVRGPVGQSAYELALTLGFVGTEAEYEASLHGQDGSNVVPTAIAVGNEIQTRGSAAFNASESRARSISVRATDVQAGVAIRGTYSGFFDSSSQATVRLPDVMTRFLGNSVQVVPNSYQADRFATDVRYRMPIPLEETQRYIRSLHEQGYQVMLKPHVEVNTSPYVWRATITPSDPAAWLASYKALILDYARICEEEGVEFFCVGTEYDTMTEPMYSSAWRDIIASVRQIYGGHVTFGATFNTGAATTEAQKIDFWDALDSIGLNVYVRVTPNFSDSEDVLRSYFVQDPSGNNMAHSIEELSNRWGRPVIYTEYGYPMNDADNSIVRDVANPDYPAYFARHVKAHWSASSKRPWFLGGYLWAVDFHDAISDTWGEGGPVEAAMRSMYAARRKAALAAGPRRVLTRAAGATAVWARVADVALARLGDRAVLDLDLTHTQVDSTDARRGRIFMAVSAATSLASNVSVKLDSPQGWRTDEVGVVFSSSVVQLWLRVPPNGRVAVSPRSTQGNEFVRMFDRAEVTAAAPPALVHSTAYGVASFALSLPSGVSLSTNAQSCIREGRRVTLNFDLQKSSFSLNERVAIVPAGMRPAAAVFGTARLIRHDDSTDVISFVVLSDGEIQLRHGAYVGGKAVGGTVSYYTPV